MTMQAPDFFNVGRAEEAVQVNAVANDAAAKLRDMAKAGKIETPALPEGTRTFMAPTAPNSRFLAVRGRTITAPFQSGVLGLQPDMRRDGDVWVEFIQGVCTTDDPMQVAWLEAHSGIPEMHAAYHKHFGEDPAQCNTPLGLCREQGPGMDVWAELKAGQHATSSRPATISSEIDIDAFMRGDLGRGNKSMSSGMGAMMAEAAANNEAAKNERKQGNVDGTPA